jgi:MFS family permease
VSPAVLRVPIAVAAGLALADASVVVLALPPILSELDTSVEGVAAVIGAYTLALALALPAGEWLRRRTGAASTGVAGLVVFGAAGAGCGAAATLEALVVLRAVQAVGAALALVAAFELLGAAGPGRQAWIAAAVFGAAIGPALGGALTQLFDWRAIFRAQVPVAALAAVACAALARRGVVNSEAAAVGPALARPERPPPQRRLPAPTGAEMVTPEAAAPALARLGSALALALVSAALTGVLFLLVLLLVTGWSLSPLAAAAVVTTLPLGALAGARVPGDPRARAAAGCALAGSGVLVLAFLPGDAVAWTIAPQALAGLGMGLALPALAGGLLRERTPADAAKLLAARHLGITVALALLAPLTANQLDSAVDELRLRGTALVLDSRLTPIEKLQLAELALAEPGPGRSPRGPRPGARRAGGPLRRAHRARCLRPAVRARRRDARLRPQRGLRPRLPRLRRPRAARRAGRPPAAPRPPGACGACRRAGRARARPRPSARGPARGTRAGHHRQSLSAPRPAEHRRHRGRAAGRRAHGARPRRLPLRLLPRGAGARARQRDAGARLPADVRRRPPLGERPAWRPHPALGSAHEHRHDDRGRGSTVLDRDTGNQFERDAATTRGERTHQ